MRTFLTSLKNGLVNPKDRFAPKIQIADHQRMILVLQGVLLFVAAPLTAMAFRQRPINLEGMRALLVFVGENFDFGGKVQLDGDAGHGSILGVQMLLNAGSPRSFLPLSIHEWFDQDNRISRTLPSKTEEPGSLVPTGTLAPHPASRGSHSGASLFAASVALSVRYASPRLPLRRPPMPAVLSHRGEKASVKATSMS